MRNLIRGAVATAALAVIPLAAVAASVPAGAATASPAIACGSSSLTATGQARESLTVGGTTYYVAAPNKLANGKAAVFKTAVNGSSSMTYCNTATGSRSEITIVGQDGRTYALTNRGGTRAFFEVAHGYPSQLWDWTGSTPPDFHFANVKESTPTLLWSLRAPNAGPSNYGAVAVGAHASLFHQTAS